jgi:tetratricopeptide (TPR) repeat protein
MAATTSPSDTKDSLSGVCRSTRPVWASPHGWAVARSVLCFLAVSITLAAGSPQSAAQAGAGLTASEEQELIELEEHSKFLEALRLVEGKTPEPQDAEHQKKLKAFARDFPLIDQDIKEQRFKEAEGLLQKNRESADVIKDPGLVAAERKKTAELHEAIEKAFKAQLDTLIAKADKMQKKGKYAEAAKCYDEALALNATKLETPLTPSLRNDLEARKLRAEESKTKSEATFWAQFWRGVSAGLITLATWIICFAVALLFFRLAGIAKAWLPPETGARVVMDDLTGNANERDAKSQALTRDMSVRLTTMGASSGESTELDDTPDLDSANLPNLVIHHDPQGIDVPLATTAATVGPFSINPAQLLAVLQKLMARRAEYSFKGSLVLQGARQAMVLECVSTKPKIGKKLWQSKSDNSDPAAAREEALSTIVEKVAFEFSEERSTNSFASFHCYRAGRALMNSSRTAEDRAKILTSAAQLFRDCIQADPGNWMGWFYLATVLRKCGKNKQAANHFKFLQELLQQPTELLKAFLASHTDFPIIVDYNYAVCLSKLDTWKSHGESVDLLGRLIEKVQRPIGPKESGASKDVSARNPATPQPGPQPRPEMEMLFRSARVSALTFELDPQNEPVEKDPGGNKAHRDSIFRNIEGECEKVAQLESRIPESGRRTSTVARAVMKNAYGWALLRQGRSRDAVTALSDAITLMPDFVDAYLNLAEILIGGRSKVDPNWIQEAQSQLDQALLLSPSSPRAHYLSGRLLAKPAIGEFEKAKEHLLKAELFPNSYFLYAQILKGIDGNPKGAIEALAKSIARFPRVDYRYVVYAQWIIEFINSSPAGPPAALQTLLENALSAANKLHGHGIEKKLQSKGQELLGKLNELKSRMVQTKPIIGEDQEPGDATAGDATAGEAAADPQQQATPPSSPDHGT